MKRLCAVSFKTLYVCKPYNWNNFETNHLFIGLSVKPLNGSNVISRFNMFLFNSMSPTLITSVINLTINFLNFGLLDLSTFFIGHFSFKTRVIMVRFSLFEYSKSSG